MIDAAMMYDAGPMTNNLSPHLPPTAPHDKSVIGAAVTSAEAINASELSHRDYVTQLFDRYRASLHRYLVRLVRIEDAAELVQETFFRMLRHDGLVRFETMARAFLFHTATNLARDQRRRRVTHHAEQHIDVSLQEIAEEHRGPDEQLASEQTLALIERAIADLPADTRTVFMLHRFRELSYPQIAQTMNLSARTVARKMAEALEQLASALEAAR
jgi:RNA polymerase sigma factor (sigma-70 family)